MDWLLDPFASPIVQRALAEVLILSVACGPLGVWVLLYRDAYAAESISHGMLPGLVVAALADLADVTFGALSGGQRQRVLIARALLQEAPVLLLDEPLSGVDSVSAARIEAVFAELRDEGRTLLVATHDVRQAAEWDRVLCLHGRQIEFGRPAAVLSPETLRETYGAELIVLDGGRAVGVGHHGHAH